jgi:hypothetical protein
MAHEMFMLKRDLSLAFQVNGDPLAYGDLARRFGAGFNASLEVGWKLTNLSQIDHLKRLFKDLCAKIDHRHLGLDEPELGITTPESLLLFSLNYLKKSHAEPQLLRFKRAEDIVYEWTECV